MTDPIIESLWAQVRAGHHVAAIGLVPFPLAGARGISVVRISCEGASTLGPLGDARVAIQRLLGVDDPDERRGPASVARALLDEAVAPAALGNLIAWSNRLVEAADGRAALVIDAVDAADEETIQALEQLLADQAMRLPIVLSWHDDPDAASARLVEVIRAATGEQGVARAPEAPTTSFVWSSLPADALEVLRAAAIVGSRFDAEVVAALLDIPVHRVLGRLQQAADAGAPLRDEGTGAFVLPREGVRALREGMLPSWASHLHARLAAHHDGDSPAPSRPADAAPPRAASAPSPDPAAAGRHLVQTGNHPAAIERFIAAAAEATEHGDCARALAYAKEAEALLAGVPRTPPSLALLARVHVERARAQWAGAGQGPTQTLRDALASIEAAVRALPEDASPALRADIASTLAAIAYEIGEPPLAAMALERLSRTRSALVAAGELVLAARLSNDDAALRMRFGSAERAVEILSHSREMLLRARESAKHDPSVVRELAVTEHLFARAPLHAGQEVLPRELAVAPLEHAQAAQALYTQLGNRRGVARVLETMGRLELRAGLLDDAQRHLLEALQYEHAVGDATGLARTTDALAELFTSTGHLDEALELIEGSAALNLKRGAPSALAFNRRALELVRAAKTSRGVSAEREARIARLEQALAGAFGAPPPPHAPPPAPMPAARVVGTSPWVSRGPELSPVAEHGMPLSWLATGEPPPSSRPAMQLDGDPMGEEIS